MFGSIRRILSIVSFFVPSLGLFSILYHHRAEQIPFSILKRYERTQDDRLVLFGMKDTVFWWELDRWDYNLGTPSKNKIVSFKGKPLKKGRVKLKIGLHYAFQKYVYTTIHVT